MALQSISLFSGAGGDTIGMSNAGVHVVAYNELVPRFCETHNAQENRKYLKCDCTLLGNDVNKIKDETFASYKGRVNLVFAGFVCQSFSSAGKRNPKDLRGQLYKQFVRAAKHIQPKFIIGENVKGLLTCKMPDGNLFLDVIEQEFKDLGYTVNHKVLKGIDYGVPQKRERLFIIGRKDSVVPTFPIPQVQDLHLKNIITYNMLGAIKISKEKFDFTTIPNECILTNDEDDTVEVPDTVHPYLRMKVEKEDESYGGKTHKSLLSFGKRDSPIHCEIIDIRKPSKTIICTFDHQPRLFVPLKNKTGYYLRSMLPDEMKQIQGFPRDYVIKGNVKEQITQIGNAVPPSLVEAIVKELMNN